MEHFNPVEFDLHSLHLEFVTQKFGMIFLFVLLLLLVSLEILK